MTASEKIQWWRLAHGFLLSFCIHDLLATSDQTVPCCDSTCLLPRDKLRLFWQINVLALHILCLLFYSEIFVIFVYLFIYHQFSSVQSLSRVRLFATPWIAALQASLSITNSRSSPKLICIESVMPSSHLILCRPLLLLPPIPPGIRVFSNESTLRMRWPKYWSFSFSISPSSEHPGLKLQKVVQSALSTLCLCYGFLV